MKRIITAIVIFTTGFVGGVYTFLRLICYFSKTLHDLKIDLVEGFEYLLLGYNTVKGPRKPYSHYPYTKRPYSSYSNTRYYYGGKEFEEDEEDKDDN